MAKMNVTLEFDPQDQPMAMAFVEFLKAANGLICNCNNVSCESRIPDPQPAPAEKPKRTRKAAEPAPQPEPQPAPAPEPQPQPQPAPQPQPQPAPAPAPATATEQPVTLDDIRKNVMKLTPDTMSKVKARLTELGVHNLSELRQENYREIYDLIISLIA